MKAEKKLQILSVIFIIVVCSVIMLSTEFVHFGVIPSIVGSDWLTVNNQGLLSVIGVKWWENHNLLVAVQLFTIAFGFVIILVFTWFAVFVAEVISILGYMILSKRFNNIYCLFDELVVGNIISCLDFSVEWPFIRQKNMLKLFGMILGSHFLFLLLAPILIILFAIKWFATGLVYITKLAV